MEMFKFLFYMIHVIMGVLALVANLDGDELSALNITTILWLSALIAVFVWG